MDLSSRKRKGLGAKGKLAMMSLYRGSTSKPPLPSSAILHHHQYYTTATSNNMMDSPAVKQERVMMMMMNGTTSPRSPSSTIKQRAAVGGTGTSSSVEFIVNQEQVSPQAKQSVSVVVLPDSSSSSRASHSIVDSLYGGVAVDESVDIKASTYISTVRERIRLQVQTINS